MKKIIYILFLVLLANLVLANECGVITENLLLENNVYSNNSCFIIDSSNLIIDCNNHKIFFAQNPSEQSNAFLIDNKNNITIKNCEIYDNNLGINNIVLNVKNSNDIYFMDSYSYLSSINSKHALFENVNYFSFNQNLFKSSDELTQSSGSFINVIFSSNGFLENNVFRSDYDLTLEHIGTLNSILGLDPLLDIENIDFDVLKILNSENILINNNDFNINRPLTNVIKINYGDEIFIGLNNFKFNEQMQTAMHLEGSNLIVYNNNIVLNKSNTMGIIAVGSISSGTMFNSEISNNNILVSNNCQFNCLGILINSEDSIIENNTIISNTNFQYNPFRINFNSKNNLIKNNNINALPNTGTLIINDLNPNLNLLKYKNNFGSIFWNKNSLSTMSNLILNETIIIEDNFIEFNGLIPLNLLTDATIEFYNLDYNEQPIVLANNFERCDNNNGCEILNYNDGNLIVNIDSFEIYKNFSTHSSELVILSNKTLINLSETLQLYVESGSNDYSWSIIEGEDICSVDSQGLLSPLNEGECIVLVYDNNWDIYGTLDLIVSDGDKCGDLYESIVLSNDVYADGTCFNVKADDITIDCNGHSIYFGKELVSENYAIFINQKNNISIINCNLLNIEGGSVSKGIYSLNSSNIFINNNYIEMSSIESNLIELIGNSNFKIENNNLSTSIVDDLYKVNLIVMSQSYNGSIIDNYLRSEFNLNSIDYDLLETLNHSNISNFKESSYDYIISLYNSSDINISFNKLKLFKPILIGINSIYSDNLIINKNNIDIEDFVQAGMFLIGNNIDVNYNNLRFNNNIKTVSGVVISGTYHVPTNYSEIKYNEAFVPENCFNCFIFTINGNDTLVKENTITSYSGDYEFSAITNWHHSENVHYLNNNIELLGLIPTYAYKDMAAWDYSLVEYNHDEFGRIYWNKTAINSFNSFILNETILINDQLIGLNNIKPDFLGYLLTDAFIEFYNLNYNEQPIILANNSERCDNNNLCTILNYDSGNLLVNINNLNTYQKFSTHSSILNVYPEEPTIFVNSSVQLNVESGSNDYSWIIIDGFDHCEINQNGFVEGKSEGQCTVLVTDNNWDIQGIVIINVLLDVICGDLYGDVILNNDLYTNSSCFNVKTNDITIDCDGHFIFYSIVEDGSAVINNGFNNGIIKNCNFYQENYAQYQHFSEPSIKMNNANNWFIYNNIFSLNATNSSGIFIKDGNNYNLENNQIIFNGLATGKGIILYNSSYNFLNQNSGNYRPNHQSVNELMENLMDGLNNTTLENLEDYISNFNGFITLFENSSNNLIFNNSFSSLKGYIFGFYISKSFDNSIKENDFETTSDASFSIRLFNSKNNLIENNTFKLNEGGLLNIGVKMTDSVENTIKNNYFDNENYHFIGVFISNSNNNLIQENLFDSTDITYSNPGVLRIVDGLYENSFNNLLLNNIVNTNGILKSISTQTSQKNILEYSNNFGLINWNQEDLTTQFPLILGETIIIEHNKIGLLGDNFMSLNQIADIELYNLDYDSTPIFVRNGLFRCDNNNGCEILYENNTIYAKVEGFSYYESFPSELELFPQNIEIELGETVQISTTFGSPEIIWSIANGNDFCTINNEGILTGLNPGQCHVLAEDKNWNINGTAVVTVLNPPVECGLVGQDITLSNDVSSNGTCFTVLEDDITIDCNGYSITFANTENGNGIYANDINNLLVKNCEIIEGTNANNQNSGIYLTDVENSVFENVNIFSNKANGIYINNGLNNNFKRINLEGNNKVDGLYIKNSEDIFVNRFEVEKYIRGIRVEESSNVQIESSTSKNNMLDGIFFLNSENCLVKESNVDENLNGIYFFNSNNSTLIKNLINENSGYGIRLLKNSDMNLILLNNVLKNNADGLFVEESSFNNIKENILKENFNDGIRIHFNSNENIVELNTVTDNKRNGITSYQNQQNTYSKNTACENKELDFNCEAANNIVGNGNKFNKIEKCDNNWPVYVEDYVNCNGEKCFVTDDGINPYVRGTVFALGFDGVRERCIGSNPIKENTLNFEFLGVEDSSFEEPINGTIYPTVKEYSCNRNHGVVTTYIRCDYGCVDGACVRPTQICSFNQESEIKSCEQAEEKELCSIIPGCDWEEKCVGKIDCNNLGEKYCEQGTNKEIPEEFTEIMNNLCVWN